MRLIESKTVHHISAASHFFTLLFITLLWAKTETMIELEKQQLEPVFDTLRHCDNAP